METQNANAADLESRDGQIAEDLRLIGEQVGRWAGRLETLCTEASEQGAYGHAGLYESVQAQLTAGARDVQRAAEYLRNGDPEEHSDWRP